MLSFLFLLLTSISGIHYNECGSGMNKLRLVKVTSNPYPPNFNNKYTTLKITLNATATIQDGTFAFKQLKDSVLCGSGAMKVDMLKYSDVANVSTPIPVGPVEFTIKYKQASTPCPLADYSLYLGDNNNPGAGDLCVNIW
ncbi:uncharacterized protein MONOS_15768 [Monocercomonoides exilis]|uniref:uncharacterized protein n=1 Tax=Monocercomonoides exilis TaxID=2049356 RepID=UPI0035595F60|nr:hypothetical protein MONOS_15768 [Monocercomonoides exilis]|eukprot:MONOS_15768.1-p1 / transcript=MONOS_15768.1 / gene=MONOS_15768 / organism=Monocercomonoides_exilis_PA203 / gene_product=unspecified product / transcript_product=unspecified product / location=Mono_scaffold01349:761-1180(-) / protein_length=140 / sequence_SO=supercontig / SO=protein_coding / is_pseudo=false